MLGAVFDDELINQDMITPDYIIERGKKIAEVFVNGIFKNFIEN
jgi:hypothetical protein